MVGVYVVLHLTAIGIMNGPINRLCAPADNMEDCRALVNVYWATGSVMAWPMDGNTSMCSWDGVNCTSNSTPRVTSLDLINPHGAQPSGTIPSQIAGLEQLSYLALGAWTRYQNGTISGTLPTELGVLQGLNYLNAGANRLSGTLPSEISGLSSLNGLFLASNKLSGTIPSKLFEIETLGNVVVENRISGTLPTEIGGLTNLWQLDINDRLSGTLPSEICDLVIFGDLDCLLKGNSFACPLPSCGARGCQATCK